MTKLGLVANGRSWRNRASGPGVAPAGVPVEAPETLDGYPAALKRLAEAGVTVVAVDGGDGTLRDVLSALPEAFGDELPAVALLPNGKTNVAAADVGGAGRGPEAIARLAEAVADGSIMANPAVRRPIEVTCDGWTRRGFVFGLGAFERATRLANEQIHTRGFAQGAGVALGVAMSGFAAFGKDRAIWLNGVPLAISVDGGPERDGASFALLATSLKRLMLGLWPFWGNGEGAIDLTEIASPPKRLVRAMATAGLGRPPSWAEEAGYRSVKTDAASLRITEPFIFDGDTFAPAPDGRVELRAGPAITFVRP